VTQWFPTLFCARKCRQACREKVGGNSPPKKGGIFPPKKGGNSPPILSKALKSPTPYRVKGQASVKYLNKHRQIYYITVSQALKSPTGVSSTDQAILSYVYF